MNAELKSILDEARKVGACSPGVKEAEKFDSVDAVLASSIGPTFACWYAAKVLKGRWAKAEQAIQRDANCWNLYRTMFSI